MRITLAVLMAVGLTVCLAAPALADGPNARDIESAVDSYLGDVQGDTTLIGGPGSAGYDQGFWIRGGQYSLQINLTLQARYEAWVWDDDEDPLDPFFAGGDLSGFSLPRGTVKFSGTAPCSTSYYLELEFGHFGDNEVGRRYRPVNAPLGPLTQSHNYDTLREAWLQWSPSDLINFRMGQIRTAATRQLMVAPEYQQFADISLASAFIGSLMPGYTDRNRDHGFAIHGRFGTQNEWSYLTTVTNGDGGDSVRNVVDGRTSDNLAFSGRVNWAFLKPIGYEEGALRQNTCDMYGEVGAWGFYYADRDDLPHVQVTDALRWGVDLALGYKGFSFTGAASFGSDENAAGADVDYTAFLAQLGYHFPGTSWEIAARWSSYDVDNPAPAFAPLAGQQHPLGNGSVSEIAVAVNYYLAGHGNKMSLDLAMVSGSDAGSTQLFDAYTGYQGASGTSGTGDDTYGFLLRFQWQLAL